LLIYLPNFIGLIAGVGILTPVSLHSIPVIGQIAGSVATSLRQFDATFGGLGWRITSALNTKANPIGLRAGTGCGVALGYGWGVGVMLKPNALESVTEILKSKIPPSLAGKLELTKVSDNAEIHALINAKIENGAVVTNKQSAETPAIPKTPLQSITATPADLEKEVAALTKIVLQQQLALEKVNEKVETLQLELSQQKEKKK
jgi:hypothetical protein